MKYKLIKIVDIESIDRTRDDYGDLSELAASMKSLSVLSSFAVEEMPKGKYRLLAGGRRLKAAEIAGIDEVPAVVFDKELTSIERKNIELAENIHRKDLDWPERIKLEQEIHNLQVSIHGEKVSGGPGVSGWSGRDTAVLLSVSHGTLARDLIIADAIDKVPEIGQAKSKDEAERMLKSIVKTFEIQDIAKKIEEKTATDDSIDILRKKLIKMFIITPEAKDALEEGFFAVSSQIQSGSVKLINLDPPWAMPIEIQEEIQSRTSGHDSVKTWIEETAYLPFLKKSLEESYRILATNGWLLVWFAPDPWFIETLDAIKAAGFSVKGVPCYWCKGKGFSHKPTHYLSNSVEMFFYARKGSPEILKPGKINSFHHSAVPHLIRTHPTEKPIELMQDIFSTFCKGNDMIMSPFLGSGNDILAAANLDLTAFGYDLSQGIKDTYMIKVYESYPPDYRTFKGEQ